MCSVSSFNFVVSIFQMVKINLMTIILKPDSEPDSKLELIT